MKAVALIFWMLLTIILTCTIVGLFLFIPKDNYSNAESTPSTWMFIGRKLLYSVINQ